MQANFLLGSLKLTEPARILLKRIPMDLIARHAINDHGLVTEAEQANNAKSMETLGKIVSRYHADPTKRRSKNILIETAIGWGETTVSLE